MRDAERIALELLEYKVADIRHRRPVRGGPDSVWQLQRDLEERAEVLEPDDLRRFRSLSRELGLRQDTIAPSRIADAPGAGFDELVLGDESAAARLPMRDSLRGSEAGPWLDFGPPEEEDVAVLVAGPEPGTPVTPAERREHEALHRLAQRVFGRDVERFAEGVAATWRAERERATARIMFATLRNLERFRNTPGFERDANLRQFRVTEPLPPRIDPLVSLSDVDSLQVIAKDVVETVLRLRDGERTPQIERRDSLDYLHRAALEVARDPWAGKRSPNEHRGPSASELRAALRDLARERLPDWQRQSRREDLEARLRERHDVEREQRVLLRRDAARFAELVEAFFARLERVLPRSVGGGAEEPQLGGGVLFALSPALRKTDVPKDVRALTVRLAAPVRLPFLGRDLTLSVDGDNRHLYLDGTEIPLDGDRTVPFGDHELEVFSEGDYLHLRMRETGGSLAARTAEAAATLHVLASPDRDAHLAILRLLAPGAPGDPGALIVEAVRRAGQITAHAPNRREALLRLIAGAARAMGSELPSGWLQGFVQRIQLALSARPDQLEEALVTLTSADVSAEPPVVVPFGGEPADVSVGGRTITIRRYGQKSDHLVAMLPGQVLGAFQDHLIEALGTGTLVCVHGQQQLVVAYLPGIAMPTGRS